MTLAELRLKIHPSRTPYVYKAWTTLRRKATYGWTERQVRKQLVPTTLLGKRVYVHSKVAPAVKRWNDQVRQYENTHKKKHWIADSVECFNWRPIRGGTTLSRQAHAIAIDLNSASNPMHSSYHPRQECDIPRYVIQLAINNGFQWGGSWSSPVDSMHFQRH